MVTDVLDQRRRFVEDLQTGRWTMSELCARYGISRPTGYLWQARYEADGVAGLEPRRSAPHLSASDAGGDRGADRRGPPT